MVNWKCTSGIFHLKPPQRTDLLEPPERIGPNRTRSNRVIAVKTSWGYVRGLGLRIGAASLRLLQEAGAMNFYRSLTPWLGKRLARAHASRYPGPDEEGIPCFSFFRRKRARRARLLPVSHPFAATGAPARIDPTMARR
jgi:hypothetical protein